LALTQKPEEFVSILRDYRVLQEVCEKLWKIVSPLTLLLKINSFVWNEVIEKLFLALKYVMFTTHVLVMLYFTLSFILECDASCRGLGVVLMQEGCALEFTRNNL